MKKKKSAQDILVEGIKNMPPIHVAYLMQRLQHDTKELIHAIPSIYDKDREDMNEAYKLLPDPSKVKLKELVRKMMKEMFDGRDNVTDVTGENN